MGLGASLVLAALGAILVWAVNVEISGVNLDVVGWILLVVGIIGALLSLLLFDSMPWRGRDRVVERERDVY